MSETARTASTSEDGPDREGPAPAPEPAEAGDGGAHWRESAARAAARAYEAAYGREIPDAASGARLLVRGRTAVAAALAILVAGGVGLWMTERVTATVPGGPEAALHTSMPTPSPFALTGTDGGALVIQVSGAVASPGLVEVGAGARVADAVEAAGGLTAEADLTGVNLARAAVDGEHVSVPAVGEEPAGGGLVSLNSASAEELEELPGVGPVLAGRIVADRDAQGPFQSVEDVQRVSGVGPAMVAGWEGLVQV
ncbi:ComEA family DNA-binding protein [Demequina sp. NBRC 110056]|uniref:ComEA family DNA-binding protein n=1 Tax=Demequina sp. NBRC 110056 TaxID=1570345 RepID=UPI001F3AECE5|nr:ComEA family DNA-binding protein [Demequina sp. NBRC 110056]